jgi:hypothetical protein
MGGLVGVRALGVGRLAWTVVPALLVVMALETEALRQTLEHRRRLVTAAAALLALGHTAYWVMRTGPF